MTETGIGGGGEGVGEHYLGQPKGKRQHGAFPKFADTEDRGKVTDNNVESASARFL